MKSLPAIQDQADIEAVAADWLVRRGDTSADDDEEFYAWLETDPRHGEAFDELARALEDVGQLKDLAALPKPRRWAWVRRAGPALAAACVAALALVIVGRSLFDSPQHQFETAVAEMRVVELEDGSIVTLGADSRIGVRFEHDERRIVLNAGEAFFEVARDASRTFYVEAGGTLVRVVGTKFNVHRGADRVRVSVEEGRVEVRDARAITLASPAVRLLTAGQRTEVQERPTYVAISAPPPPAVESVTVARPGAWRGGRLAYDDARLAEVVADINRYYSPGVRLAGSEAEEVRVTASFRVDEIPAFLSALSETMPVSLAREPSGGFVVSAERLAK